MSDVEADYVDWTNAEVAEENFPADEAPKPSRGRPKKQATLSTDKPPIRKSTPRVSTDESLRAELVTMYMMIGSMISMGDNICGNAVMSQSQACADAWMTLAKSNPKIKKALKAAAAPSGYVGLALAHVPLVLTVYAHHLVQIPPPNDLVVSTDQPT